MLQGLQIHFLLCSLLTIAACQPATETTGLLPLESADTTITLLFTNDIESAYDPIPAFWRDDMPEIGGTAEMTTLIEELRRTEPNVFLFDSGDIFTGALAKLTKGEVAFELMITMAYDAMAIGNHEFEYGQEVFAWAKNRAPFPVLGANLFYKGTGHPYAQSHAVVERQGVRIGVIGVMGHDPAEMVRRSVDVLHDQVDLIVVLAHQGKTAPMQTDAESDPRLQRDIDADIRLAGAVNGIDVLLTGHADAGTPEPVVHPKTQTLIMQTYGQATHLGYLQLTLDGNTGEITNYNGKLIPVDPSKWKPDPRVAAKLQKYRGAHPELMIKIGTFTARMNRRYVEESDLGNLFTDVFVDTTGADIGFLNSGALRKDLPMGDVLVVDLLDTYPFIGDLIVKKLSGDQIRRALEQSLTLERGLLQVSGLNVTYDMDRPELQRIVALHRNGIMVTANDQFIVAAPEFLSEGGDLYESFAESAEIRRAGKVSDILIDYFRNRNVVTLPTGGRQTDVSQ